MNGQCWRVVLGMILCIAGSRAMGAGAGDVTLKDLPASYCFDNDQQQSSGIIYDYLRWEQGDFPGREQFIAPDDGSQPQPPP
jgi:hypothetical protein